MEGSKNTQPIDRPINGELLACLTEPGSSKKKRTNNRGKGGPDRVEHSRNIWGEGRQKEGRDKNELRYVCSSHTNQ